MKHFFGQFFPKDNLRNNIIPVALISIAAISVYILSLHVETGIRTYLASCVCLCGIGATALARISDIKAEQNTPRWHVRRFGLGMVFAGSIWLMLAPVLSGAPYPGWRNLMFQFGILLVWVTTPGMPPWWRYISGEYRSNDS